MQTDYKKEWSGESGYCNCLLVAMCRLSIPKIELNSNLELPNLETLATTKPETSAWLRVQEFKYSLLDSKEAIRILSNSAGISQFFWGNKTGEISVYDVVGYNGPTVERKFKLNLSKSKGVFRLIVELETAK